MANVTTAFGLRPVRHIDGSPWNGQTKRVYISASYATALFVGDPVLWSPTLAEKDTTAKHPTINVSAGTTGTVIRGVITEFEVQPTSLESNYSLASTEGWANICIDPSVIYEIRDDGSGTPAKVFAGQNAVCAAGSGGSTITGISSYSLDASTPTTTQAHTLHILGLSDIEDNELADYAIWDVLLNTCENATGKYLGITAA